MTLQQAIHNQNKKILIYFKKIHKKFKTKILKMNNYINNFSQLIDKKNINLTKQILISFF